MVEPYIVVESAKQPIVEQCLLMGPKMVLYQYLNRQLISNSYLFSSVYTFAKNCRNQLFTINIIIHSSQVITDCKKLGVSLQINTQTCPKKENDLVH